MTKIELNKKDFIKCLAVGGTFAGKSRLMPILDCVKIKVSNGHLKVVSSDGENAISTNIDIDDSACESVFCTNFKDLSSYVRLINSDFVTLNIKEKELEVKHDKGSLSIPLYDANEFPIFKSDDRFVDFSINSCVLNNWIADSMKFVSYDMLRPQLSGVYIYRRDGEIGCCGTDGHKLFYDHIDDVSNDLFEFIVNKNSFSSVCNVCKSIDNVRVKVGDKNTMFIGKNISLIMRNVEGKFPSHKSVIRQDNNINVIVTCDDIKEAILRCVVGAGKNNSTIKLEIKDNELMLNAQDFDFNIKTVERLSVESDGNVSIGFKSDYLLDVLNTIDTDKCLIKLKDSSKAGMFYEYNNGKISSNKISLLMPILA